MNILCFDISSSGISACVFNSKLDATRFVEAQWSLETDADGAAALSAATILDQFKTAIKQLTFSPGERIDAISIDSFMHNCLLLDAANQPLTPVFTWLDQRGSDGVEFIRARLGDQFHQRTGCRFHPMFPIFKLAAMRLSHNTALSEAKRVVSIKSLDLA